MSVEAHRFIIVLGNIIYIDIHRPIIFVSTFCNVKSSHGI